MHEGSILTDIAWIMVGAMVAALLFQRLRLPPLLGYLVAGFFLAPIWVGGQPWLKSRT